MFVGFIYAGFLISFYTVFAPILNLAATLTHSYCTKSTPATPWSFAYAAIVCGTSMPSNEFRNSLQVVGLIHLMVVSGSHLVFIAASLEYTLAKFSARESIVLLCLIGFTLMTGIQAPAVRALVAFSVRKFSSRAKLFWPPVLQVFISGLFTLVLFPQWISSYSLLLSWGAAFALTLQAQVKIPLQLHVLIFLVLFPVLLPIAPSHPISIFANWLLAPVIGSVLFPLSLTAFLVPSIGPITDFFWSTLATLLNAIASELAVSVNPINIPLYWLWLYIIALNIGFYIFEISRRRHNYV